MKMCDLDNTPRLPQCVSGFIRLVFWYFCFAMDAAGDSGYGDLARSAPDAELIGHHVKPAISPLFLKKSF